DGIRYATVTGVQTCALPISGVASALLIRDDFEGGLRSFGLPDYIENGGRELPLVVQDKIFVGDNILLTDPTWTGPTAPGSLWYEIGRASCREKLHVLGHVVV